MTCDEVVGKKPEESQERRNQEGISKEGGNGKKESRGRMNHGEEVVVGIRLHLNSRGGPKEEEEDQVK